RLEPFEYIISRIYYASGGIQHDIFFMQAGADVFIDPVESFGHQLLFRGKIQVLPSLVAILKGESHPFSKGQDASVLSPEFGGEFLSNKSVEAKSSESLSGELFRPVRFSRTRHSN